MSARSIRSWLATALVASLLATAVAATAWAAEGDETGAEPETPLVTTVKPKRQKIARTAVGEWTRIRDPRGDLATVEGRPVEDAAGYGDITAVSLSLGRTTRKLVRVWGKDFPIGAADAYRGAQSELSRRQDALYLVVETAANPPKDEDPSVQLIVGFSGPDGQPLVPGAAVAPTAGLLQYSQSGVFPGGVFGSGTTDTADDEPGEAGDLYDGRSRDFGYLDRKKTAWFHVAIVPEGAEWVTVALQSTQDGVVAFDQLRLPSGERFLDLDAPLFGFPDPEVASPVLCRSIRTALAPSTEAVDGEESAPSVLIETTVGLTPDVLADIDGESATLELMPFDAELAQALLVEAGWDVNPTLGTATARFEVPEPGDFHISLVDHDAAGEDRIPLLGLGAAIGGSPIRISEGASGLLGGDDACGRWHADLDGCDALPWELLVGLTDLAPDVVDRTDFAAPNGFLGCAGLETATGEPFLISGVGTGWFSTADFAHDVESHRCPAIPLDAGAEAVVLDCGMEGFESLFMRVVPDAIAASDPDGGLLVSIDIRVPVNEDEGSTFELTAMQDIAREMDELLAATLELPGYLEPADGPAPGSEGAGTGDGGGSAGEGDGDAATDEGDGGG